MNTLAENFSDFFEQGTSINPELISGGAMEELSLSGYSEFAIFRITTHPKGSLIPLPDKPEKLLHKIIQGQLTTRFRSNSTWHIANNIHVENFSYFRIGKIVKSKISILNEDGNFADQTSEEAPYSHVFLIRDYGVIGISKNIHLSPKYNLIGEKIVQILNDSDITRDLNFEFQLRDIYDSSDFFARLGSAYSVKTLWVLLKRKNPWDINELFVKPTTTVLESLAGNEVKTEWTGPALSVDQPEVKDIVTSAAATGGDAGATVKDLEHGKYKRIRLKKGLITLDFDAGTLYLRVFQEILSKYLEVRHGGIQ